MTLRGSARSVRSCKILVLLKAVFHILQTLHLLCRFTDGDHNLLFRARCATHPLESGLTTTHSSYPQTCSIMPSVDTKSDAPENLFHILLTIVDLKKDASGGARSYFVLGTRGTLHAAKAYSTVALRKIGFHDEDFAQFDIRPSVEIERWPHGEGVIAYARAVSGEEFLISIDTTPNNETLRLKSVPCTGHGEEDEGILHLPNGAQFLHYVLQITIDYNADRSGSAQTVEIEGAYAHRADALSAAHRCLDGERASFVEYDSRGDAEFFGEWPFDEDVVVHAVTETGQNFLVAVKAPPHAGARQKSRMTRPAERHKIGDEVKHQTVC